MFKKIRSQTWPTISSFFHDKQLSFASWVLLFLSGILLFVFSLPHVIVLRKFLLLVVFIISFQYFWNGLLKKPKPLLYAVIIFVLLQVWMLVITGFVSDQPSSSFSEWIGQWLPTFMSFIVGIGLARTLTLSKFKDPRVAVAMIILIPICIFLCINAVVIVHEWILAGKFLPNLGGIGDHKGVSGYLIALLEPILIADMLTHIVKGKRLLSVSGWVSSGMLIFLALYLLATTNRNGILIMFASIILGAAIMISEIRKVYSLKKIIAFILATLIIILATAFASYKTDPRWQGFIETIPVAWDIDRDLVWLNDNGSNLPLTPSGKQVDISEYYRIAWAHEGWRMLMEHPWGIEIGRDTFHKLVLAKYGHTTISHSHNSWIDFGLNVGIQGLILWGWFLLLLAKLGWQTWRTHKEPLGLALAVLVIMFALRGLLDEIFRDHEIEEFMLVAGLLSGVLSFGKTNIPQAHVETV